MLRSITPIIFLLAAPFFGLLPTAYAASLQSSLFVSDTAVVSGIEHIYVAANEEYKPTENCLTSNQPDFNANQQPVSVGVMYVLPSTIFTAPAALVKRSVHYAEDTKPTPKSTVYTTQKTTPPVSLKKSTLQQNKKKHHPLPTGNSPQPYQNTCTHTTLHYSLVRSTIKNIAYHSTALYQKFAANAATCTTTTNTQFEHFCLASTFLNSHVHTHGNRPPPTC